MRNSRKKLSLVLSLVMIFQLFFSTGNIFAATMISAPANFQATVSNINDITLTWNSVNNADYYRYYELVGEQKKLVGQTPNLKKTISNVQEGTHVYAISTVNGSVESILSDTVTVTIVFPEMIPPEGLNSQVVNGNDIKLTWKTASNATAYNVYKIVDGQKVFEKTTDRLYVDFTRMSKGEYTYEVSSYSDRFGESQETSKITVIVDFPDMLPPTGLTSQIQNLNDIKLIWQAATNATSYNIYKIIDGQKVLQASTENLYRYFNRMPKGEHTFEVSSYSDRFGESTMTSKITVIVDYPDMLPPPELASQIENGNDIKLSWQAAVNATLYKIYKIVNGQKILEQTTDRLYKSFTNMPEGDYTYEVSSYNDRLGESIQTSVIHVSLKFPTKIAPVVNISVSGSDARLSWSAIPYADTYNIYELINGVAVLKKNTPNLFSLLSGLDEGTHEYVVTSFSNRFGESVHSNNVVAEIWPPLEAPKSSTASVEDDKVTLDWSPVPGADSYKVYQEVDGELKLVGSTSDSTLTLSNLEPGTYEFRIVPVSSAGTESTNFSTITIQQNEFDTTPPITSSNVKEGWSEKDVTVQLTATDDQSGVAKTFYSVDDLGFVEGNSFTVSGEGYHKVSFYSVDNVGNVETFKNVEVKIDKTVPVTVSDVKVGWSKDNLMINLSATDNLSGVYKTFYSVDDLAFVEGTIFIVRGKGIHKVSFYSMDNAGNVETVENVEVKIDNIAPVTVSDLKEGWLKENVTVQLTASDDLSGVYKTFYSIDGSSYIEGTSITVIKDGVQTITFYSVDNAGNKEIQKTLKVNFDKNAPVTSSDVKDIWSNKDVTVNLTATDDLSGVAKTFYSVNGSEFAEGTSFVVSGSGVNTVTFYSVDNAGNIEVAKTVQVKIDDKPPVTTSNVTATWLRGAFTVELSATDDLSGVAKTLYSVNGSEFTEGKSFVVNTTEVNEVSFYSIDNVGNVEVVNTVEVNIDENPPKTTSNATDNWLNQAFTVELTATDDLSGVAKTFYSVNGSDFTEGTSIVVDKAGVNEVKFYSVDNAGNVENTKTVQVKIDNTPPVTTSNATDKWLNKALTVELTATDDLSGVAKTFYSVNGSDFTKGTSVVVDKAGVNEVKFYSVDNAGNVENTKTVQVKIDNTSPVTTSNATDNWLNQAFTVELIANDDFSGVAKTFYSVNGSDFTKGTSVVVDKAGVNEVKFYSVDNAGNIENTKTVQVKIDNTPPVTTSNITDNWLKDDFTLKFTATDDNSGVEKTFYSVNGSEFVEGTTVVINKEGINEVTFYSVDKAGNIEEKQSTQVKIDKTIPTVSWNLLNEYSLGTKLKVDYLAEDKLSGVALETVTVSGKAVTKGDTITFDQPGEYIFKVSVTDKAGWVTTIEKKFVVYIPGELIVRPGIIKQNQGEFTVQVNLPNGFETNFDLSSVTLDGVKALDGSKGLEQQAKIGQFKFNRNDFNWSKGEVVVEFRGIVNGKLVVCKTTVTVK